MPYHPSRFSHQKLDSVHFSSESTQFRAPQQPPFTLHPLNPALLRTTPAIANKSRDHGCPSNPIIAPYITELPDFWLYDGDFIDQISAYTCVSRAGPP